LFDREAVKFLVMYQNLAELIATARSRLLIDISREGIARDEYVMM